MNEKESQSVKSRRDPAARKSLFERAILASWAPFSLGVIAFAALGVWALNLSSDEILELKFGCLSSAPCVFLRRFWTTLQTTVRAYT